jgi:hypothetical protein
VKVARAVVLRLCSPLLATGLTMVVLISCSSASSKSAAKPRGTTSTSSRAQLEATILSQWQAAERASVAAAKDPAGQEVQLLVDYFVDPALSFLRTQYAAYARDGLTNVGDIEPGQPHLVSATATQAIVATCATNRLQLIFKATGKPFPGKAGDATPTPNGIVATLVLAPSGVWKVSQSTVQDGSCTGV